MQPTNLLNPVLFTVLGDPITAAKCLSSLGLFLDVIGVVILLTQDLRTRKEEAAATDYSVELTQEMLDLVRAQIFGPRPQQLPEAAAHLRALVLLRGTRTGFVLILTGFVLQLVGTLIS
jgi:hypothetical protein